jgi:hypothetical protein
MEDWNWGWDGDMGSKTDSSDVDGFHIRLYARDGYRGYNPTLQGYYVIGTTHRDRLGWWLYPAYGWGEEASEAVVSKAAELVGWEHITYNHYEMFNAEDYRVQGIGVCHIWWNDGYARGVQYGSTG